MNLKVRYEKPKTIVSIALILYLAAIISSCILKVLNFELSEDSLFWTTSTIIQAFGALLALSAVYSIYRIQNHEKDLANSKTKVIGVVKKFFQGIKIPMTLKFKSDEVEISEHILNENEIELLEYFGHNDFIKIIKQYLEDLKEKVSEEGEGGFEDFCYHVLSSAFDEYTKIVIEIKEYKKSIKYSLYLIGTNIVFALIFLPHFTIKLINPITSAILPVFVGDSVIILFLIFFSAYCLFELSISIINSIGK